MADPIRVAVVGCGGHMRETLFGALRWAPANAVVAAVDTDRSNLDRFMDFYNVPDGYTDIGEMLAAVAPDAVVAAVGHDEHPAIAEAAMRAGAHVFIEKTPSATADEARRLVDVQRETGKWTMVGFSRRFMPAFAMAREIVQREEFGGVHMFQSQIHAGAYRDEDFYKINHVIHHLDVVRMMVGEVEIEHVQRVKVNDNMVGFSISFGMANGGIGTIHSGSLLDKSHPWERVEMIGNKRSVVIDHYRRLVYNRPTSGPTALGSPYGMTDTGDALVWDQSHRWNPECAYRGFEDEIHHFIDSLHKGTKPQMDIEECVGTMVLYEEMEAMLAR